MRQIERRHLSLLPETSQVAALLATISNINNVNVKKKIQTKNIWPTSPIYPEKVHTLTLLILQGVEHSI